MVTLQYIGDPKYFRHQKIVALLNIPAFLGLALLNFFELPIWLELGFLLILVVYMIYASINFYKFYKLNKRYKLQIQNKNVTVLDPKGKIIEEGELVEFENMQMEFELDTLENYKRMWQVIKGNQSCSRLKIKTLKGFKSINFWIDSYYQMNQLKKIQSQES
ncbi:MAG: hypothetical protein RIC95_12705 [Vicingaceae bacterium]